MKPADWHPTDDDLMLDAYKDNTPEERADIDGHLASCDACSAIAREIRTLQHLASEADVPEPPSGFEDAVWARLAPAIGAWSPARPAWAARHVIAVGVWAAAVSGIVVAGYRWDAPRAPEPTVATLGPSQAQRRVLLTALDAHFSQTEMLFVELMNAPDDASGSLAFERAAADDLMQSGRLYRETAAEVGDNRIANVLDDLQPVLTEVARGPERFDKNELAALRAQIEDNDLLFKVRAVTNDIRDRRERPARSEGAL